MSLLPPPPRLVLRAGFAGRKELTADEPTKLHSALADVFTTAGHKLAALTKGIPDMRAPRAALLKRMYEVATKDRLAVLRDTQ